MDKRDNKSYLEETLQPHYLAGSIICIILVILCLTLRFIAQRSIGRTNELDNWIILVAAVVNIFLTATFIYGLQHGLGKHQARVDADDPHPPSETIITLKVAYIMSVFQGLGLLFSKLSILLFFKRVFTTRKRPFHVALLVVGAYSILVGVGSFIEFAVQCIPASFFWERAYAITGTHPPHPLSGWCMPQDIHIAFPLIANLVSDLFILGLPVIGLWGLQMQRAKKAGVFVAFSVGLFVCIIECIRIYYAFKTDNTGDATWDNAGVLLWTAVESCVSVMCACIPTMAPLLKHAPRKPRGTWDLDQSGRSLKSKMFVGFPRSIRLTDSESTKDLHPHRQQQQSHLASEAENVAVVSSGRTASKEQDIPLEGIQVSHAVEITRGSF